MVEYVFKTKKRKTTIEVGLHKFVSTVFYSVHSDGDLYWRDPVHFMFIRLTGRPLSNETCWI